MAWYDDVLFGIGAPDTNNNRVAMVLWAQSEGMPDWENNWLATTIDGFGGYVVNGAGVKAYPTYQDGVAATVATLQLTAYSAVVVALANDAGLAAIWRAINASLWCAGCQSGQYPVALYDAIGAPPITVPAGTPQPVAVAMTAQDIAANGEWEQYRSWVNDDWKKLLWVEWELQAGIDAT